MRISLRASGIALAAALASPLAGLHAETLVKFPPELRFIRITQDTGQTGLNVAAESISFEKLPDEISEQVRALLISCTGSVDEAGKLHITRWTTDWTRKENLAPSYYVDFNGIRQNDSEECPRPVCTTEGCIVLGFAAQKDGSWAQDFELSAQSVRPVNVTLDNGQTTTFLEVASAKPDCERMGGALNEHNACIRHFSWRNYGLMLVPLRVN